MPQHTEAYIDSEEYVDSENMADILSRKLPNEPKTRIFIVCPVRPPKTGLLKKIFQKVLNSLFGAVDPWTKNQNAIKEYVAKLEADGCDVYWPPRDNPYQKIDKNGIFICEHNREKMFWANEIHIWYDKNSTGSVFDIGMFFMFVRTHSFKKFIIINDKDIAPTLYKCFENVILALGEQYNNPAADGLKEKWAKHGK